MPVQLKLIIKYTLDLKKSTLCFNVSISLNNILQLHGNLKKSVFIQIIPFYSNDAVVIAASTSESC